MRILADENIEIEIVAALRQADHSVFDIKEISPGVEDSKVLEISNDLSSILLTNDKDFGELIYRDRSVSNGVILFRFGKLEVAEKMKILPDVLEVRGSEMDGAFTVITANGVRMRK